MSSALNKTTVTADNSSPTPPIATATIALHNALDRSPSQPTEKHNVQQSNALPWTILTKNEIVAVIAMTSFAGFLSPISGAIYYPVIPTLATDFNTSVSLINLTVTTYLIFQGVSPMFWAPLADIKGRRPVYLVCLAILCVTCVAIAVVPRDKWWLLLIFRCFQSAGSASTVALGSGVVADIAEPHQRGSLIAMSMLGGLLGPCLGPILGGVFAGSIGWRWIFWWLTITSGLCFVLILLFLPETLRRVVGNGSIRAPWWNRPLIPLIGPYRRRGRRERLDTRPSGTDSIGFTTSAPPPVPAPSSSEAKIKMNPLRFILQLDVVCMLISNSLAFGLFTAIQATTSLLFKTKYTYLTEVDIGLCYLPTGLGAFCGIFVTGRLTDRIYKSERRKWEENRTNDDEGGAENKEDAKMSVREREDIELTFPAEKTRLKASIFYSIAIGLLSLGFGWMVDRGVQLAGPLIFQFIIGWCIVGQTNAFQTLLIDDFPKQGSTTTAINNLFRCTFGAVLSAVINPILNGLGIGFTFTLLGGLFCVSTPLLTWAVIKIGPKWRRRRLLANRR